MKKLFIKLTIIIIMSVTPLAVYNYITDPYGIFHNSNKNLWYEPGYEPNQHYSKMRHLIHDKHSWDSYLFGSSRVGKIDPDLIPGGNYYNMNYSEGIPGEHLADIKILLKKGVPVKNIMIGMDNVSYTIKPEDHIDQIFRHPYDGSEIKRIFFQIKYLFFGLRKISGSHETPENKNMLLVNFNIMGNGLQNLEKVDKYIEQDVEHHINSERFQKANNIAFDKASGSKHKNLMGKTLEDIEEIITLSKRYHFKVYFFLNPTYYQFYLQGYPYEYLQFKKKLARITDYWDFSGFNAITTNSYYWYEISHYRIMVGDLIICRMTNCTDLEVPDDFGVFVNKENVNDHIKKQERNLQKIRK